MTIAAGILFVTPGDKALFLQRGNGGDYPGSWCFPGGHTEAGETAEQTAEREAKEELGFLPEGARSYLTRSVMSPMPLPLPQAPGVEVEGPAVLAGDVIDFTTFLQKVPEEFAPKLDGEHSGWAWSPLAEPPRPMHPGCQIALDRLNMDELGVARAIADGRLTSPQRYMNVTLWAMRITGTGIAFRSEVKDDKGKVLREEEFPWRDPAIYMNEEFCARCNGLAVIWVHPKKATLDSKEFANRVIGAIMLPYLRTDLAEVWGIAKVYDDEANAEMALGNLSTSPSVVLGDPNSPSQKMKLEDGSTLLIEGKPRLLDHLAVVERGVWDKGKEPSGVINDSVERTDTMTPEEVAADKARKDAEEKARADKAKADADAGEKLDKFLSKMDSVCARMDAFEAKEKEKADADMKAKADADAKAKADAEEEEKKKSDPERVAADKAKKDADEKAEKEAKEKADAEEAEKKKADSVAQRIADVEKRLPMQLTDADYRAMADRQARADGVFHKFGQSAPRPLNGEDELTYRRRLATTLKVHSTDWKGVDLCAIADSTAFKIAEDRIYADADVAAMNPMDLSPRELREITRVDSTTGQRMTTFVGAPGSTFIGLLKRPSRRVTRLSAPRKEA